MRTAAELVVWYEKSRAEDFCGFALSVAFPYFPKEQQGPYLKEGAEPLDPIPVTKEEVRNRMESYMAFAWEKALGHRGISADRSIQKMRVWLFLMGDDGLVEFTQDDANYAKYGAPILKRICEAYGFPIPNDERALHMANGLACTQGCDEGCDE